MKCVKGYTRMREGEKQRRGTKVKFRSNYGETKMRQSSRVTSIGTSMILVYPARMTRVRRVVDVVCL